MLAETSFIEKLFENPSILLFIFGSIIMILGVPDKIHTKWFKITYNKKGHRTILFVIGIVSWLFCFYLNLTITNQSKPKQENVFGEYEWQWAGENWIGKVFLAKNDAGNKINLDVNILQKIWQDSLVQIRNCGRVMYSTKDGNLVLNNGNIEFADLECKRMRPGIVENIDLSGTLYPITAFAGKIKYTDRDKNTFSEGDMVLVKHKYSVTQ
jgi:hypothetical protein